MFWNILSVENTKILKRRMLWIELGIVAGLLLVLFIILYATLQTTNEQFMPGEARAQVRDIITWPEGLQVGISIGGVSMLGGLLVIVLVGAVTAQEYTWRTMHLWLSRGLPRPVLIVAKFAALLLPIFLFVLTPFIFGGGLSAIFTLLLDKSLPVGQIQGWHLLMSFLRTVYTLLPYAALTFMLAIVTRSTAAAIGVGLAYSLIMESVVTTIFSLLGGILRDIVMYLPGSLVEVIMRLNDTGGSSSLVSSGNGVPVGKSLDPTQAAIGIALWTLLFLGLAVWSFHRQDLSE